MLGQLPLFVRNFAPPNPSVVYSTRLKEWWYQNTTGSPGVSTWTAETGTNLTQATSGSRPTASTTTAGKKSIVIDQSVPQFMSASVSLSGSPTSYQIAFAFKAGGVSGGGQLVCLFQVFDGTGFTYSLNAQLVWNGGPQLQVQTGSGAVVTDNNVTTGWHTCIVDVSTTGSASLYLDGVIVSGGASIATSTGFGGISAITALGAGDAEPIVGSNTGSGEICSPCIATDTSNFTSTDRTNINNWLKYVAGH